jgi:hypothetical protein
MIRLRNPFRHEPGKYRALETIRTDLNRLKWLWGFCCSSPIIYFLVARFIETHWFDSPETKGFWSMSTRGYITLAASFVVMVMILQVAIVLVRRHYDAILRTLTSAPEVLLAVYTRCTFILLLLSETCVLFGFILFLVQGDIRPILPFGLCGLLFYAQAYPGETRLGRLTTGEQSRE